MTKLFRSTVAVAAMAVPLFLSACGSGATVDYLYVTAAGATAGGTVFGYAVDGDSGYITGSGDLLYPSGGLNAQGSTSTGDGKWVYVMNKDDDTIVEFGVRVGQGTITPIDVYNSTGTQPVAITHDTGNQYLYVVDNAGCVYVNGVLTCYSSTNPGIGDLTVYSIDDTTGNLTLVNQQGDLPVGKTPTGVAATPNAQYAYVANSGDGTISVFALNGGKYAPVATVPVNVSGASPYAVYATATTLYVTDYVNNAVYWFTIQSDGTISPTPTGQSTTDKGPNYIAVDPTSKFLYITNYFGGDLNAYTINSDGSLTNSGNTYGLGSNPRWIAVSPQGGPFLYTANYIDNSVSGYRINTDGTLTVLLRFPIAVNGTHISSVTMVAQDPGQTSSSTQ